MLQLPNRPLSTSRFVLGGLLAGGLSGAVLVQRGRRDAGSGAAPINAVSHWLWPGQALRRDDVSMKHTATGAAVHLASSLLWAWVFDRLRARRRAPTALNAVADAVAVTALASWVDLELVPDRLSPGFQKRLSARSTGWVYAGFAAGLALAGLAVRQQR